MNPRRTTRSLGLVLLLLASCPHDDEETAPGTEGTTAIVTTSTPTTDAPVADSTGAPLPPTCIDDYLDNHDLQSALDLSLDTTVTTRIVLGDGFAAHPPEAGADELVVCDAAPSDFFQFHAECPSFVSLELRALDGTAPDLLLYDESFPHDGPALEHIAGVWNGFFLKPLHRDIAAGSHAIEVRHPGGGPRRYDLTLSVYPRSGCAPA